MENIKKEQDACAFKKPNAQVNKYVVEEPPSDIHERFNVATMEPTRNKLDEVDIKKKEVKCTERKAQVE